MTTEQLLHEGLVPTPGKRIRRGGLHALTGLRFFAACWVMAFHFGAGFSGRKHMPYAVTNFLQNGNLGVVLFFMLSGFILYYSYAENLETLRDLYKFFVARFARLYPVYFLMIAICCLVYARLPHGNELLIFPMLQSWGPANSEIGYTWNMQGWTISVEAFFYCCFPLLLLLFRRTWSLLALWSAVAAVFLLAVMERTSHLRPVTDAPLCLRHIMLPLLCLPQFILGLLLGVIFLRKRQRGSTPSNDWITFLVLLPCAGLIIFGSDYLLNIGCLFGFGWAIYRLANGRGWLSRLLSTPLMLLLGGASYSIYLFQGPMREIARRLFASLHPGLDAVLAPILLIAFSCLLFLFYEEPVRDLIRKLLVQRHHDTKHSTP